LLQLSQQGNCQQALELAKVIEETQEIAVGVFIGMVIVGDQLQIHDIVALAVIIAALANAKIKKT
jgi:hypothetical protein